MGAGAAGAPLTFCHSKRSGERLMGKQNQELTVMQLIREQLGERQGRLRGEKSGGIIPRVSSKQFIPLARDCVKLSKGST